VPLHFTFYDGIANQCTVLNAFFSRKGLGKEYGKFRMDQGKEDKGMGD
jgi:hypothetical protein